MHIFRSIGAGCLTRYRLIQVNLVLNRFLDRFRRCFRSDYKIRCCRGALPNLENQHTLVHAYIQTHWLKDVHTLGKYKITKTTTKLLGNFNSSFCFSLYIYFFLVLWMVVSLRLYNCVYNLGYLSFTFSVFFVLFLVWLLFCFRAEHNMCKVCMYLTCSLKRHGATICTTLDCLFILRSSTKKRN